MSDLYLRIAEQPDEVLDAISVSMDKRAAEPEMRDICAAYLAKLPRPGARVLEIGCGNGASTSLLKEFLEPESLVGVDPSSGLVDRARVRFEDEGSLAFEVGDALQSGQPDEYFDIVVAHTVYSHLLDPNGALNEAYRVLKPGGALAVFDGDYATNTVALFEGDPLQVAMTATQRNLIHDCYIMRRLPRLAAAAGFEVRDVEAHGYTQRERPEYLLSLLERGVKAASSEGEIDDALANGFMAEATRRVSAGEFYGAILFISLIAQKPLTID